MLLAALDLATIAGALEGIAPGSARGGLGSWSWSPSSALVLVFVAAVFADALLDQRRAAVAET